LAANASSCADRLGGSLEDGISDTQGSIFKERCRRCKDGRREAI
jgi:hypothetical protein